jgi:hypothetical protein
MVTMRKNAAYLDDDDMVPDGGSVKVRLELMDALQRRIASSMVDADAHRPHFAQPADAALEQRRREARQSMIDRATTAWRMGDQAPDDPDEDDDPDDDSPYEKYKKDLSNAWRKPSHMPMVTGFGPAAVGPGPRVVGAGPTDSRDAQAIRDRDAAWNEYRARLSNAWRGGR